MFGFQDAELLDDASKALADGGEMIFDVEVCARVLGAGDETVFEEAAEAFHEDFRRYAGDEALQFSGTMHSATESGDDASGPSATHDVFEAAIGIALVQGEVFRLHAMTM